MSRFFALGFLALIVVGNPVAGSAGGDILPRVTTVLPDRVFIPAGFDDNDNIQIVVKGYYTNTCFQTGPTEVQTDVANKKIFLRDQAYYTHGNCPFVDVLYLKNVEIGILPAGDYEVVFLDQYGEPKKSMGTLPVALSNNVGPDDHMYAPVTNAMVMDGQLYLTGTLTSTCMRLGEVELLHHPERQVLVVLPKLDMIEDNNGVTCVPTNKRYTKRVPLNVDPGDRELLIHIRSLNGQALNLIIDKELTDN